MSVRHAFRSTATESPPDAVHSALHGALEPFSGAARMAKAERPRTLGPASQGGIPGESLCVPFDGDDLCVYCSEVLFRRHRPGALLTATSSPRVAAVSQAVAVQKGESCLQALVCKVETGWSGGINQSSVQERA